MSEQHNQHGRREAPGTTNPLAVWWRQHREWVAGLDRGAKLKYRAFQVLVLIAVLIIAVFLFLRSWMRLPDVPEPPNINAGINGGNISHGDLSSGDISFEPTCLTWPKAG